MDQVWQKPSTGGGGGGLEVFEVESDPVVLAQSETDHAVEIDPGAGELFMVCGCTLAKVEGADTAVKVKYIPPRNLGMPTYVWLIGGNMMGPISDWPVEGPLTAPDGGAACFTGPLMVRTNEAGNIPLTFDCGFTGGVTVTLALQLVRIA